MGLQQISMGLVILSGGVFLVVQGGLLAVLWRRRRQTSTGVPLGVEAVWTLVPALLLALLLLLAGGAMTLSSGPGAPPRVAVGAGR